MKNGRKQHEDQDVIWSEGMKELNELFLYPRTRELIIQLAREDVTVILTGEPGTGKTTVAKVMHKLSQRSDQPFVKINSSLLDGELLESRLFGHTKGSFTGATGRRLGLLKQAHKGTFFIDDLQAIAKSTLPKLLQVLEEGLFRPVGCDTEEHTDGRFLIGVNEDPHALFKEGVIKPDFISRVAQFRIHLPP